MWSYITREYTNSRRLCSIPGRRKQFKSGGPIAEGAMVEAPRGIVWEGRGLGRVFLNFRLKNGTFWGTVAHFWCCVGKGTIHTDSIETASHNITTTHSINTVDCLCCCSLNKMPENWMQIGGSPNTVPPRQKCGGSLLVLTYSLFFPGRIKTVSLSEFLLTTSEDFAN